MRVAVVGAGINGIMSAWALANDGHGVALFERGMPMDATSSASSKLLHGGLRYLEHGEFRLVREGLRERAWWIDAAPHHARPLELVLPVYRGAGRSRLTLKLGLLAYDLLAGRRRLGWHRWQDAPALLSAVPELRDERLRGGYRFVDGQMDDRALGLWALARAVAGGVQLRPQTPVDRIDRDGGVTAGGSREAYDCVVNAAGPWAEDLLRRSGIPARHRLDLVRGSHLVIDRPLKRGFLLQSPDDARVCFVLPWQGRTLVGTTEVRQALSEPVECSAVERGYLLNLWNAHFRTPVGAADVVEAFAGLRPLVAGVADDQRAIPRD